MSAMQRQFVKGVVNEQATCERKRHRLEQFGLREGAEIHASAGSMRVIERRGTRLQVTLRH